MSERLFLGETKKFYYAVSLLMGTIVGVGVFGIPYVSSQAGVLVGLTFLFVLGLATLIIHLLSGEIAFITEGKHRLVGYAEMYLGAWAKRIVAVSTVFGMYGALLAYIIVGGEFLHVIFSQFFKEPIYIFSLAFFVLGSIFILTDLRAVSRIELFMSFFLILIVLFIFLKGIPLISLENLSTIDLKHFFLPYGVILFSLSGAAAIPELKEFMAKEAGKTKKVIFWGTLIPVVLYAIFAITIAGITGQDTSPEAIKGLIGFFGPKIITIGAIFGVLACFTSFLVIGVDLKKIFWYDYRINRYLSWFLVSIIPIVLFFAGIKNFIEVVGLVGVIMGGIDGIAIVLIYHVIKRTGQRHPEYNIQISRVITYGLIAMFALGILYQVIYFFI